MANGYRSSQLAIDRQRAADAKRGLSRRTREPLPVYTLDGTHTVTAMLDAGLPVGPDLLAAARRFVAFWGGAIPPHWAKQEDEWRRRVALIEAGPV